jgi:hypothetical protein
MMTPALERPRRAVVDDAETASRGTAMTARSELRDLS